MAKRTQLPEGNQKVRVAEGVYLKASGKYLATYRDPGRSRHWKEFRSLGEAKRWRAKALIDPASVQEGRRTLDQVWADFVKHHGSGVRPTTLAGWSQQWRKHIQPRLGTWPVGRITVLAMKDFLTDLEGDGVGAATRRKVRAILHRVFEDAVENGEMAANPAAARGTRVKADPPRKQRILSPGEVKRVLVAAREVARATDALAIEMMFTLGLRIGAGRRAQGSAVTTHPDKLAEPLHGFLLTLLTLVVAVSIIPGSFGYAALLGVWVLVVALNRYFQRQWRMQ